jgi:hypothetical protein
LANERGRDGLVDVTEPLMNVAGTLGPREIQGQGFRASCVIGGGLVALIT